MVGRPIDQHAAEHRRQPTAQRHSDRIDRDRDPQPARRKSIGDRRIGTGRQRRLPPPPPPAPPTTQSGKAPGQPPPRWGAPHPHPPTRNGPPGPARCPRGPEGRTHQQKKNNTSTPKKTPPPAPPAP